MRLFFVAVCVTLASPALAQSQPTSESPGAVDVIAAIKAADVPVRESSFHGFEMHSLKLDSVECRIVSPKAPAEGKPWVWRARFWGHQPQFDLEMLRRGWHVVYCDVAGLFGNDVAIERWDQFYRQTQKWGLHEKPFLEGMSRGGLIVMRWASANANVVAGIYVDNAVMDFRSWPAAKFLGADALGTGATGAWKQCLQAYGLSEDAALRYSDGPLDRLKSLAEKEVPIYALINEADDVVPPAENGDQLVKRYRELGGKIIEHRRPGLGHHPHGLQDPKPIVQFAIESL
ncbi:MAG: hypothetical protein AAFX06_02800 [Planctomycetota bacterium]